jgi:hypothetical protein
MTIVIAFHGSGYKTFKEFSKYRTKIVKNGETHHILNPNQ